jgi:hypothetical protein
MNIKDVFRLDFFHLLPGAVVAVIAPQGK